MFRPLVRDAKSLIQDFILPTMGRSVPKAAPASAPKTASKAASKAAPGSAS
ncbi:hypothetical protein [Streptomyces sp. HPF1205]|uniref:hypothetical protein n=1 Tax=Streptomyces sp. HPF1205 TaxID=2873262 RepID=UPI001CEDE905|nr:hypothetical protein [Streptomyces sp. HPF1205]